MGTHNQNLVPGTDNTYDLGSSALQWKRLYIKQAATDLIPESDNSIELGSATKPWKDLYLRHGAKLYDASAVIFELDYRGLFRDKFCGKATLIPAATGNADYVEITLPVYIGMTFIPQLTGPYTGVTVDSTVYDVYPYWHAPTLVVVDPPQSIFQAYVTFHAYLRSTNAHYGSWNNFNQLVSGLGGASPEDLAPVKDCYWAVRWPL